MTANKAASPVLKDHVRNRLAIEIGHFRRVHGYLFKASALAEYLLSAVLAEPEVLADLTRRENTDSPVSWEQLERDGCDFEEEWCHTHKRVGADCRTARENTDSPIPPVFVPLSPSAAPGVVPVPRNTRQDGDDTETETADEGFWRRLATREDFDPYRIER